ncbi:MAG: TonB-dependent receptor plug domain-containing protein, partial [Roseovarius indicus]
MATRKTQALGAARLGAAGLLLLSAATAAYAQAEDENFDLGTLTLQNQEDATGPVGADMNPPTVTGTKAPVTVSEVPQSVSVLGREKIERFGANRVSEALRYTAGVTSDVFGDDDDYDWLRIRGFQ